MRRILSILCVAVSVVGVLSARVAMRASQSVQAPAASASAPAGEPGDRKLIDLKSDVGGPVAPGDSVIFMMINFAAQHNGAVITCDSAVRYSDMRIEFFGNVLINKNTTYIYGDRAEYNGDINEARVYSDLVKVVDGDATLYTYDFRFDTKDNIGEFGGGGVLINRDNRLESMRGFYYADAKELVCVDQVEMRNNEYELRGDSVVYNLATDNAYFFRRTNIWNRDGDYLYADRGEYRKADSLYIITQNGYVLTDKQEMWSDSIDYYRMRDHVILRHDLQIDDTEHKVLAFGDYGEYWKEPGNAFLSRRPSVVSYDLSQGDSLFMRADSMFLFTVLPGQDPTRLGLWGESIPADSLPAADSLLSEGRPHDEAAAAGMIPGMNRESTPRIPGAPSAGVPAPGGAPGVALPEGGMPEVSGIAAAPAASGALPTEGPMADSLQQASGADSLATGADSVQLTAAEQKALRKEEARQAREQQKAAAAEAKKARLAEIAAARRAKAEAMRQKQEEREKARFEARKQRAREKLRARRERAARKGLPVEAYTANMQLLDSLIRMDSLQQDSLVRILSQRIAEDSLARAAAIAAADSTVAALPGDSIYRLMKGYRNVQIFRSDFQAACDSMTAISVDSTIHLYINPVLWNQNNQVTSEVMDIYTANQQLARAEFIGAPMMASEIDTTHYNQVAGKEMTAFFRDNEIYRNDVDGNARTLYYMQDGEPPVITMMGVIESGNITFHIEDKQVVGLVWRIDPTYQFYPIDQVPPTQELYLKGFKWEGARRPTQQQVFDRRIRPSERERRMSLPHPEFPIMQRIEEHKRQLIEQRRWSDRNDQVDPLTVEWMHDLGYEVGQPR